MTTAQMVYDVDPVFLHYTTGNPIDGRQAMASVLRQAEAYVAFLRGESGTAPRAAIGRVRGTGPGVSFGSLVEAMRTAFSVEMISPFEGSHSVAGGVLLPAQADLPSRDDGFLFLRFAEGARDLPMHTHEDSDRLIYVLEGRGFFHTSHERLDEFSGEDIRHVPVRSRDVLLFRQGVMHTFSTQAEPLLLLSYHAPFVPLEDPRQYTVPDQVVCPADTFDSKKSRIGCDPAWSRLV